MYRTTATRFLVFLSALCLATQTHAQLTTYRFMGISDQTTPNPALGSTITGTVTIDEGAPMVSDGRNAFEAFGQTAISVETETGLSGSSLDRPGTTSTTQQYFEEQGTIVGPFGTLQFVTHRADAPLPGTTPTPNSLASFQIIAGRFEYPEPEDQGAPLINWTPTADGFCQTTVRFNNVGPDGESEAGSFQLVVFEPIPDKLVVNGVTTDIDDFEYNGELLSTTLSTIAEEAIRYGMYDSPSARNLRRLYRWNLISRRQMVRLLRNQTEREYEQNVSRLAASLRRAELMTQRQARQLVRTATSSFEITFERNS